VPAPVATRRPAVAALHPRPGRRNRPCPSRQGGWPGPRTGECRRRPGPAQQLQPARPRDPITHTSLVASCPWQPARAGRAAARARPPLPAASATRRPARSDGVQRPQEPCGPGRRGAGSGRREVGGTRRAGVSDGEAGATAVHGGFPSQSAIQVRCTQPQWSWVSLW
jgi:hypothetical protein